MSFAAYLAQHTIARKGFSAGTVPEAAALIEASDIVLTRSDGMALLRSWRADSTRPAFLPLAAALCAAGALAFAWSIWPALRDHRGYARDPRSRLYQAQALIDARDLAGAERELRAGLAEREILSTKFDPDLTDRNQHAEAKAAAQSACAQSAASFAAMREVLVRAQLCEK